MSSHRLLALLAALSLSLAACSGSDPAQLTQEAYADLGRSDYSGALAKFQSALKELQPSDPKYVEAKLGEIEAWCYVDAPKAKDEFLAYAKAAPDKVTPGDYKKVASNLTSAHKFDPAIAVLTAGRERYPKDESVYKLGETIKAEASKAGDESALKALRGLGYL